jgi:serine/threonine protein kinase
MGVVYLAEDPELGRLVAVKVPRFADAPGTPIGARQRFLREARAAAAVRHPHVCPIYDVGEQDGAPYAVMAYIEGRSLADRLRDEGRFEDPRAAVALAVQVAEGLASVHDRNLVHRDLKASNVLLDGAGQAFLSDFGLARRQVDSEPMTAPGALVGTLGYMAPEQADGAAGFGAVTPLTDLFSLGVVLYEMLTGRRPFEAESPARLLYRIVHDSPVPPRRFRPDLDSRLEAVMLKALARSPADRWTDGRTFAAALRRAAGGDDPLPEIRVQHPPAEAITISYSPPRSAEQEPRRRRRFAAKMLAGTLVAAGSFLPWQPFDQTAGLASTDLLTTGDREPDEGISLQAPRPGAASITAHDRSVRAVAFSPDGRLLATAGDDALHLWDVAAVKRVGRIPFNSAVHCLAFSPDGQVLASGGADPVVTLWDMKIRELKGTITVGSTAGVGWVRFAPDGRTLVTVGHRQKTAVLWDVATGAPLASLDGHTDRVRGAAFSPDSKTVATVSDDRTGRLWDAATGRVKAILQAHDRPVNSLAFSPDGTKLATGSDDQSIVIWDVATGQALAPKLQDDGPVVFVGWTPDGRIVSKTFRDGVRLWTSTVNRPVVVREAFDKPIAGVSPPYAAHPALTSDGRVLAFRHCHPYSGREVHFLDLSRFPDAPK